MDASLTTRDSSTKAFMRELRKVVERSDVVIQVLDARDPEGTRSRWVEEEVRKRDGQGKKLLAVVNKIGRLFLNTCANLQRLGPSIQPRSVVEIPTPLVSLHAIQILDTESKIKSVAKLCSLSATVHYPGSNRFTSTLANHFIFPRCTCPFTFAQTIFSLYPTFFSDCGCGRLPQRR